MAVKQRNCCNRLLDRRTTYIHGTTQTMPLDVLCPLRTIQEHVITIAASTARAKIMDHNRRTRLLPHTFAWLGIEEPPYTVRCTPSEASNGLSLLLAETLGQRSLGKHAQVKRTTQRYHLLNRRGFPAFLHCLAPERLPCFTPTLYALL